MVEVWDAEVCRFCGASTAFGPTCPDCAKLLASFILSFEQGWLNRWWMLGADAAPQANMRAVIGGALPSGGSGEQSRSEQAMAHAHLSSAYLVMQLPVDALFTAAKAIEFCIDAATAVALRVLFDARLMRPGAEQSLRDQLFPH